MFLYVVSSLLDEITASFRRFGHLFVDWPHKAESKSYFPPKGMWIVGYSFPFYIKSKWLFYSYGLYSEPYAINILALFLLNRLVNIDEVMFWHII